MKRIIFILLIYLALPINACASYVLINSDTKDVIYQDKMHEKRLIASITKVMTAYIVIKNTFDLDKEITVGKEVLQSHGSSIYLSIGEKITIRDLLYGLLLRSGNDAAIVLAVNISGSVEKFVNLMNDEARNIGMNNTLFQNPTGLDDSGTVNISTAYDMSIITAKALKNDTFKKIFKTKKYTVKTNKNTYSWTNKNKALFLNDFITGGKTGYTKKAHRTLITSASLDDLNLVMVSLNIQDDFNFHINNYKKVFKEYKRYILFNRYSINTDERWIKNKYLYAKHNFYYVVSNKNIKNIKISYTIYKKNKYKNHEIVGSVKIYDKTELIFDEPIYYLKSN